MEIYDLSDKTKDYIKDPKLYPFITEEENRTLTELISEIDKISFDTSSYTNGLMKEDLNERIEDNFDKADEIRTNIESRYIESFSEQPDRVFEDILDIVKHIGKARFLGYVKAERDISERILSTAKRNLPKWLIIDTTDEGAKRFFINILFEQYNVIDYYKLSKEKADKIVTDHITKWKLTGKEELSEIINWDTIRGGQEALQTPSIAYAYPETKIEMINKISDELFSPLRTDDQVKVDITPKQYKKNEQFLVRLTVSPKTECDLRLTPKDKELLECAVSLAYANNLLFTAESVAKAYYHKGNPSKKQIEKTDAMLNSFRKHDISIDYTDHAKLNNLPLGENDTLIIKDLILSFKTITAKINGKERSIYMLTAEPPTFEYSRITNQITEVPFIALEVPINLSSDEVLNIRAYLLEQISHNDKWGNTFTFETIFKKCGIEEDISRKKRKGYIDSIKKMLDWWKQKEGGSLIKDYSIEYGKKNSAYSVTFIRESKN